MSKRMIREFFGTLSKQNEHPRDRYVSFKEEGHLYFVTGYPGSFTSVTKWKDTLFTEFDSKSVSKKIAARCEPSPYFGLTAPQIETKWDEGRYLGEWFHRDIEGFLNDNSLPPGFTNADLLRLHEIAYYELMYEKAHEASVVKVCGEPPVEPKEWQHFMRFVRDNPHLKPFRTEWTIYHEEYKLSGTIDAVFTLEREFLSERQLEQMPESQTGPLYIIVDWKRARRKVSRSESYNRKLKERSLWFMEDTNYWRYAVQLNLYRIILMDKYNIRSNHMYVVRLHPDSDTYQTIRMPVLDWSLRPLLLAGSK